LLFFLEKCQKLHDNMLTLNEVLIITMNKVPSKTYARIKSKAKIGWVCSPVDFLDIGSRAAVDQALSRMVKTGMIRRIARGLYDVPRFNGMLNDYAPPSYDQIIMAIARRDGIKIIPDNIVHANGLGLTNAVPAKSIYLTDGPSKTIIVGGWSLRMKHVPPAFMSNATSKSGPVFQALAWIGKDAARSSIDVPSKIRSRVSSDVLSDVKKRASRFPVWMKPVINDALAKNELHA
jgi:hypothetical protein